MPDPSDQQVYDILCRTADQALAEAADALNQRDQAERLYRSADLKRVQAETARDMWRKLRPDVQVATDAEVSADDAALPPYVWVEEADRFLRCYRPRLGTLYLEWNRDNQVDPEHPELTPTGLEGWWLHGPSAGVNEPLFCGTGDKVSAIKTANQAFGDWEDATDPEEVF